MAKNDLLVWNYFRSKGFTEEGTAGLMGNLQAESGIRSDRKQGDIPYSQASVTYTNNIENGTVNMVNGKIGYGLAQWTYSTRQRNLYNFMKGNGLRIDDLEGQCAFLYNELSSSYGSVFRVLSSTSSIREASNSVLLDFERPADQSISVQNHRYELSKAIYETYSGKVVEEVEDDYIVNDYSTNSVGGGQTSLTTIIDDYMKCSDLGSQPYHAFVDLIFDDVQFTKVPPEYLINLNVQYLETGGSTISLVLLDKYSDLVEEALLNSISKNNYVRYGHVNGKQSELIKFDVYTYSLDFQPSGTLLTVTGVTSAIKNDFKSETFTAGNSPSEAVKQICRTYGYDYENGRIDDCDFITLSDGTSKTFNLINHNPINYITNELAPYARRLSDGKTGYKFYLDETQQPPIAYFHPVDLEENVIKTYVHRKGLNSCVINFSITSEFHVSGEANAGANTISAEVIDPITKEESSISVDVNDAYDVNGEYSHSISGESTETINTSGMNYGEAINNLKYRMTVSQKVFDGMLTIIGDTDVKPNMLVRIIVLMNDYNMHHTSGIYMVKTVSHSISSGIMTTTMGVVKNADIEGVKLRSYTRLIK